jgi:TetR/AcrR family transcriptional regulator, cholesterol catabolism regulator
VTRASDAQKTRDVILGVVLELLESGGYDAVRLREVAKRARLSLAKIYKLFPTRQELIVSALERWMEANAYAELTMPGPDEPLPDVLMRVFRTLFEPWERSPRMLEAYHRAETGPGGERLRLQGMTTVEPISRTALEAADAEIASDIEMILGNVVYALIARFADGQIEITDILPALERTVFRLTGGTPPRPHPPP